MPEKKTGERRRRRSSDHGDSDGDEDSPAPNPSSSSAAPTAKKPQLLPSMIKNKAKRSEVHAKLKQQKKTEKRKKLKARTAAEKRALELGEELPPRKVPRTIENTREADETICKGDDEELFVQFQSDEFSSILNKERSPKVLITTSRFHSTNSQSSALTIVTCAQRGPAFISELLEVIPNATYYKRGTYGLKKIVKMLQRRISLLSLLSTPIEGNQMLSWSLPCHMVRRHISSFQISD